MKSCKALLVLFCVAGLSACGTNPHYNKAFSDETQIKGNHRIVQASPNEAVAAIKQTLVARGFTLEPGGGDAGPFKAHRKLNDPEDEAKSYEVDAVLTVIPNPDPATTKLYLAANQKTVLRKEDTTWWKLLWIIPLFPLETTYETVVLSDAEIADQQIYDSFFDAVDKAVADNRAPAVSTTTTAEPIQ